MGGEVTDPRRDPRRDPRPGDVLSHLRRSRTVVRANDVEVCFTTSSREGAESIWLASWRRWARTAVVVTVAPEEP